jgi:hypothetical protein
MWQDHLHPCAVFTKLSERFAPYYLAEIRHDLSQTTGCRVRACAEELFVVVEEVEKVYVGSDIILKREKNLLVSPA